MKRLRKSKMCIFDLLWYMNESMTWKREEKKPITDYRVPFIYSVLSYFRIYCVLREISEFWEYSKWYIVTKKDNIMREQKKKIERMK